MYQETLIQITGRDGFEDLEVLTDEEIEQVVTGLIKELGKEREAAA